ncbi:hypothetical protein DAH19_26290, partial [Escherichia coli]
LRFSGPKTSIICSPMTSLKTSIKTITYLSDTGCLEIQGASLIGFRSIKSNITNGSITLLIDSNSLKNASEPYSLAGKRISLNLTP